MQGVRQDIYICYLGMKLGNVYLFIYACNIMTLLFYSHTFESVKANSEKYWRFERYSVILDYEEKIPSPFNIIFYPFRLLRRCFKKTRNTCKSQTGKIA